MSGLVDGASVSGASLRGSGGDARELVLSAGQQAVVSLRLASDKPRRWAQPQLA